MLREIRGVRQNEGEDTRRWFTDENWDLYVWLDAQGSITGFQLCYDKQDREKAFTWLSGRGYSHTKVNFDREVLRPHGLRSSVLVEDGLFDREGILSRFLSDSRKIDRAVSRFVSRKIEEYPGAAKPKDRG